MMNETRDWLMIIILSDSFQVLFWVIFFYNEAIDGEIVAFKVKVNWR